MTVIYVDVSHHDWDRTKGELDWARIRAATSPVMCARATYGDPSRYNPTSRHFGDMVRGARAAGFDVIGGYHNLITGDQASINRQVDYLRRTLDGAGANWAMLDVERYPELVSNGLWPRFDDVRQFCDRWHTVDKRVLTVYLPRWIWDGHLGRPDLRVLDAPLVASDYGSNPNGTPAQVYAARNGDGGRGWTAYGGVTPTIWQYGSNVDCPGASGQTDCNVYRGTLAQLRDLLTGKGDDDMDQATFTSYLRTALASESVANQLRALPWQYIGRGLPGNDLSPEGNTSTLGFLDELVLTVRAIAGKVDISPAELEQITAAARQGAASAAEQLVPLVVAAVESKLPADSLSRDQVVAAVEQGVREAFAGGLAPETAA